MRAEKVTILTKTWAMLARIVLNNNYYYYTENNYCAVEWDEAGHPRSVVLKKRVSPAPDMPCLSVGDMCLVKIAEGSKMSTYKAKLLGCGKYYLA